MSFRRRLLLFFLIIVVVPMVAVAVVLLAITADSEKGKADARIGAGLRAAFALYAEGRDAATAELDRVVADERLAPALATGDVRALKARLGEIDERSRTIVSITFYDNAGRPLASVGRPEGVAAAAAVPAVPGRGRVGILAVSVTDATALARRIERFSGLESRIRREDRTLGSTLPEGPAPTVEAEEIEIAGASYRGRAGVLPEVAGPRWCSACTTRARRSTRASSRAASSSPSCSSSSSSPRSSAPSGWSAPSRVGLSSCSRPPVA
ncbi:MAG: hypothetical protein WKF31_08570 [Thermoleophilaceae bacterium]